MERQGKNLGILKKKGGEPIIYGLRKESTKQQLFQSCCLREMTEASIS